MNKTLIVSYTPRNGSYTKKVLGEFIEQVKEKTEITELDLLDSPPDLLSAAHIELTMKWNAGQREFTPQESVILERNHGMANQLLKADYLVLASPVYNFSLPAMVKAWIDAIIVSNKI
jgi:FMN-dependent NADH-azoreductase